MAQPNNSSYFECPNCGADVPQTAKVCRNCGASDEYHWGNAQFDDFATDLDNDEFDYDEFVRREFGSDETQETDLNWRGIVIGLVILALLLPLLQQLLG